MNFSPGFIPVRQSDLRVLQEPLVFCAEHLNGCLSTVPHRFHLRKEKASASNLSSKESGSSLESNYRPLSVHSSEHPLCHTCKPKKMCYLLQNAIRSPSNGTLEMLVFRVSGGRFLLGEILYRYRTLTSSPSNRLRL